MVYGLDSCHSDWSADGVHSFDRVNLVAGGDSFQPTYSTSTNRMTLIGSFAPTYDNNGNVTNDNFHNYTWDADGHAITIDAGLSGAVSLTYDALGRMVEQARGTNYTQIVYSPAGQKLALMSGQTLQKAMVPLSGKGLAVYNSSGLQYYGHADLLGSIRLGTTSGRTMYFDTAYAPFGETYATSGTLDAAYTGKMNDTAHRQDTAGGLYDFPVREYATQGRWPSPDPAGLAAVDPSNPQSWNRYAYVMNNPLALVDPLGLHLECIIIILFGGISGHCTWVNDPDTVTFPVPGDLGITGGGVGGDPGGGRGKGPQGAGNSSGGPTKPPPAPKPRCIDVFKNAVQQRIQATGDLAKKATQYVAPLLPFVQPTANWFSGQIYRMAAGGAFTTEGTAVAIGDAAMVQTVATFASDATGAALKALPEATLVAGDVFLAYGVYKEAQAAINGTCVP